MAGLKLSKSDIAAAGLRGVTTEQLLVRLPLFLSNSAFWLPEADDDEAEEDDEVAALAAAHGLVGPGPDKVRGDTGSRVDTPNTMKRNASRAQSMSRGASRTTVGTSASKSASRSRLRAAQTAVTYTAKPRVLDERALKKSASVKNVPLAPEVSPGPSAGGGTDPAAKSSPRDAEEGGKAEAEAEFKTPGAAHKRATSRSGRSHSRKDRDGHSHSRSRRSRSRRREDGDSSSHAASRASRRSRSRSRRRRKHGDGHSHSRSHRGHRSKDGHEGSDGRSHSRSHRSSRKHKHRHRDRDDASAANPAVSAVTDMQRVDSTGCVWQLTACDACVW